MIDRALILQAIMAGQLFGAALAFAALGFFLLGAALAFHFLGIGLLAFAALAFTALAFLGRLVALGNTVAAAQIRYGKRVLGSSQWAGGNRNNKSSCDRG